MDISDFSLVKQLDKASPKLFQSCCTGEHIADVTLELCKAGGDKQKYMTYKFTDVLVSSYHSGTPDAGDAPVDSVGLAFGRIVVEYRPQRADGAAQPPLSAGWDVKRNTRV